jgi:hypothetical protein
VKVSRPRSSCSDPEFQGNLDRWGDHVLHCRVGRGVTVTHWHKSIRDLLYRLVVGCGSWAVGPGLAVVREQHLSFPVRVPGAEGRRPNLLFRNFEDGGDLFIDVVGSSSLVSSNVEVFAPDPGEAARRAVGRREISYRDILRAQAPSGAYQTFAFEWQTGRASWGWSGVANAPAGGGQPSGAIS